MFNDARLGGRETEKRETRSPSLSPFRDRFVLREMEKRLEGRCHADAVRWEDIADKLRDGKEGDGGF